MSSLAADLTAILAGVRRPGDFFVSGTAELRAPSLQVEGVGPVALPLLPVQAAQLAAHLMAAAKKRSLTRQYGAVGG